MAVSAGGALSVTREIAEHIAGTPLAAIPEEAKAAAKTLMLDTLGVAWAGAVAPGIPATRSVQIKEGGRAESHVWAYGDKLPATAAAFVNSSLAAALDYDSVHQKGQVHADIVGLPAALAMAERQHASGQEFLAALILGTDLICRIGMSVNRNSGWFMTSIHGVFGAAAAAARILRLSAEATSHALGIALSHVGGTQQALVEKSLTKRLQAGFSARGGVASAILAEAGITGPQAAFEGPFGFYKLYEPGSADKILDGLGRRYEIVNTTTKKYPSCTCNHTLIEGVLQTMRERNLRHADIDSVEVFISPFMHQLVGAPFDPRGNLQVLAQFSAQYSVACAILRGRLGIAEIQDEAVLAPGIAELASRVKVTVDESNKEKFAPTEMTIHTKSHGAIHRRIEHVPGTPEFPMSQGEHEAKFSECTAQGRAALSPEKRALLVERVRHIESVTDMATFFDRVL